jgi:5-formyltetrahydrofolate cyclo-ligase
MNKVQLRKDFQERREGLSVEELMSKSSQIADQLLKCIDFSSIRVVHVFLPIISRKEIDTFRLIEKITNRFPEVSFLVPIMEKGELLNCVYNNGDTLIKTQYGIPEPKIRVFSDSIPDLVITPLLAFDQRGYRVGYGGGYYDKYFATLPSNVLKVGVSCFKSIEAIDDLNEFDFPMDMCVTPNNIYELQFMNY